MSYKSASAMPSARNMPSVKPTKTERTHEENQERAYIAASRRSDRSHEAKMDSARKASEIHKRRTGKALKITDEAVANEQMYDEEDDDMPRQYRLMGLMGNYPLTPDLQRKFSAQMALHWERSKLLQEAVDRQKNSQMSPQTQQMNQSPTQMHQPQFGNNGMMSPQPQLQHSTPTTPGLLQTQQPSKRPSPPMSPALMQTQQPSSPHRSASIDMGSMHYNQSQHYQQQPLSASAMHSPHSFMHNSAHHTYPGNSMSQQSQQGINPGMMQMNDSNHIQYNYQPNPSNFMSGNNTPPSQSHPSPHSSYSEDNGFGPLTTTLPMESQQMLAGGFFPDLSNGNFDMMMQEHEGGEDGFMDLVDNDMFSDSHNPHAFDWASGHYSSSGK